MGQNSPLFLLALLAGSSFVAKWWLDDFRAAQAGTPSLRPLPGALPAARATVAWAVLGAGLILSAETWGESHLGLTAQQSHMTALAGLYTLAAAFVEELIFRGFLVVENRGRALLWAGVLGASVLFATLHPFLWEWRNGTLHWQGGAKGWFSTAAVFVSSLWFYAVRFWPLNPTRSLWPCVAAHAAKNLGVFAIKYTQGYVTGWW